MSIQFDANGKHGKSAVHGLDGAPGMDFAIQRDGAPGSNAGPAQAGEAGGTMKIHLVSAKRPSDNVLIARICAEAKSPSSDRRIHCRSDKYVLPLTELQDIEWSAQGGNGGDGGKGGKGGNGGRGRHGTNACEREPGTDGEAGGAGGNGGRGTKGGKGGNGGNVELLVNERDTFLLMKVAGCSPLEGVGDRLSGGKGGAAGTHGQGGEGGPGGDGGNMFKYTLRNITTHNSNSGIIQTVDCQYVTMSGGKQGLRGPAGATFKVPLVPGENGQDGILTIRVEGTKGEETKVYPYRYDLALSSTEEKKLSTMDSRDGIPTLEFGETVILPSVKVTNTGKMPTPPERVEIALSPESEHIHVDRKSRLFLRPKACVAPSETTDADQGYLRFTTLKPNPNELGDDYGPLQRFATKRFRAFQLGPERVSGTRLSSMSRFSAEYPRFDAPGGAKFRLAYPVENRAGISGLKILAAGESTSIRFAIRNVSTKALGVDSESQRAVHVQYYLHDDESNNNSVGLQGVKFMKGPISLSPGQKRKVLCLDPNRRTEDGSKGHVVKIKNIPAGKERELSHTLMFSGKAKPFGRASLQVDILLEDIPTLLPNLETKKTGSMSVIQRRKLVISCQPKFRSNPATQVVLVTSSATTPQQYQSWMTLLEGMLGLQTETYSLCVHGHLDPTKDVVFKGKSGPVNASLRDVFAGRLVIVLNDKFAPLPLESRHFKCRPSMLMARTKDFHPTSRWLLVGSDSASAKHLSSLGSSIFMSNGTRNASGSLSDSTERTHEMTETEGSSVVTAKSLTTGSIVSATKSTSSPVAVSTTCSPVSLFRPISVDEVPHFQPDETRANVSSALQKSSEGGTNVPRTEAPTPALSTSKDTASPEMNGRTRTPAQAKEPVKPKGNSAECEVSEATETEVSSLVSKAEKISEVAVQHENVKSYKAWVLQALSEERKSGQPPELRPGLNVALVKSKLLSPPTTSQAESILDTHASSLKRWLSLHDPVRLYVVETNPAPRPFKVKDGVVSVWNFGTLIVHRGVSRRDNSLTEVRAAATGLSLQAPPVIQSTSMMFSVATSLDISRKTACYAFALKGGRPGAYHTELSFVQARETLRDALVSEFLLEVSNIVDAKLGMDPNSSDLCTPTLQCLVTNSALWELMGNASSDAPLRALLESELSDLFARLQVVADVRDASAWWLPASRKAPPATFAQFAQSLNRLKGAWTHFLNDEVVDGRRRALEDSIQTLVKADPSKGRREALYRMHSPADTCRYSVRMEVRRQSEIDIAPDSSIDKSATAMQNSAAFTVKAKDVSMLESDYFEKQKFRERVRRSVLETRSAYLL